MYDFIIIGSGFGGLSAGALLAKKGKSVLVIEKSKNLGGRAQYFEKDGFIWQHGQHSHRLASEGYANLVFQKLGEELEFIDVKKGMARIFFKGKLFNRPEGPLGFLFTKALSFKSRIAFLKFYIKLLKTDPAEWYDKTLSEFFLEFNSQNEELELFLNFLGFTIMLPDSTLVSAGEVIDFIQRVKKAKIPIADIKGGSKQIIDKLEKIILDNNGTIKKSEKVTEIIISDKKAKGIKTKKGKYDSKNIIFAASIKDFFNIANENLFNKELISYSKNIENSGGVLIDYISEEPLTNLTGGIIGVDEPLWVKFQTLFDKSIAPKGKHVTSWGLLTEWGKSDDPEAIKKTEARLREIASLCMPGFEKKVIEERKLIAPVVNANILKPSQSKPHRVKIKSDDIKNLYFIGDTTQGDGCSGDIAFSSAIKLIDMIK